MRPSHRAVGGSGTVDVSSGNAPGASGAVRGVMFASLMTDGHGYEPMDGQRRTDGACGRCGGRGWVVVRHPQGVPEWRPCAVCVVLGSTQATRSASPVSEAPPAN